MSLIVEVQRQIEPDKLRTWPALRDQLAALVTSLGKARNRREARAALDRALDD